MRYGKKNHVNLDWLSYNIFLLGERKVGKTTLIKEACEKEVGSDGYIFLEIGNERGADAIEGINYINCPCWDMDYDEFDNSIGFGTIIDDIVANKNTEYKDLRVVVWDTYDQLINIAEDKVVAMHNRVNPEKRINTVNSAFGGYGKGLKKTLEIMMDAINRLRSVGVSTIIIGHVKSKDISDVVSGETYQVVTSDQTQNYFNGIANVMHLIGVAYIDRDIVKEKTGRKVLEDGHKVDEIVYKVSSESRKIKFRDDSYCVDCGSRFANIVPEVPLDADEFINAIKNAILFEQSKSGQSLESAQAEQVKHDQEMSRRIKANEEKAKNEKELQDASAQIISFIKVHRSDKPDVLKEIVTYCHEHGYADPTKITNVAHAKELLEIINK